MRTNHLYTAVSMSLSACLLIGCLVEDEQNAIALEDFEDGTDIIKEGVPDDDLGWEGEAVEKDLMGHLGSTYNAGVASGTTSGRSSTFSPTCGSSYNAPDAAYTWTAPFSGTFVFSTPFARFDTILHIRSFNNPSEVLGCNDDTGGTLQSSVTLSLSAGQTVYVVVDGYGSQSGNFSLHIFQRLPFASGWTGWLDRDDSSGNGDYETLPDLVLAGQVCANPAGIECQTTSGLPWQNPGEVFTCHTLEGGYCRNYEQPDGWCNYDYRVRFYCP